jgi:hypothetical protein
MAVIKEFRRIITTKARLDPTSVTCEWCCFDSDDGPILELRTGGSGSRMFPGKVSQKLQMDRQVARALVGVIGNVFIDPIGGERTP